MSAIDAGTARRTPPAPPGAARPTRRIAPTAAALLVLCAILLVGVVFVQIAVIRQNMDRSDLETRAGIVSAQNRDLETQIQQAQSSPEVQAKALQLGMVASPAAFAHPLTGRAAHRWLAARPRHGAARAARAHAARLGARRVRILAACCLLALGLVAARAAWVQVDRGAAPLDAS